MKREWEGKQLLPSPVPVQPHYAPTNTNTHKDPGVCWWSSRTTKGSAKGGITAVRAASQLRLTELVFSYPLGNQTSVRLEVTVTEALIPRVGKRVTALSVRWHKCFIRPVVVVLFFLNLLCVLTISAS